MYRARLLVGDLRAGRALGAPNFLTTPDTINNGTNRKNRWKRFFIRFVAFLCALPYADSHQLPPRTQHEVCHLCLHDCSGRSLRVQLHTGAYAVSFFIRSRGPKFQFPLPCDLVRSSNLSSSRESRVVRHLTPIPPPTPTTILCLAGPWRQPQPGHLLRGGGLQPVPL